MLLILRYSNHTNNYAGFTYPNINSTTPTKVSDGVQFIDTCTVVVVRPSDPDKLPAYMLSTKCPLNIGDTMTEYSSSAIGLGKANVFVLDCADI